MKYRGESYQKKTSRLGMYEAVAGYCRPNPSVLALSGPHASDARVADAVLQTKRVTLVDVDGAAIETSREIAPWARFRQCRLEEAMGVHHDVVVADTCGTWPSANALYARWLSLARIGDVLSMTWLLGRDHGDGAQKTTVGYMLSSVGPNMTMRNAPLATRRLQAASWDMVLQADERGGSVSGVDLRWYNSGVSPMGMVTVVRGRRREEVNYRRVLGEVESLTGCVGRLRVAGWDTERMANALCIDGGSVRARSACFTMGRGTNPARAASRVRYAEKWRGVCPTLRKHMWRYTATLWAMTDWEPRKMSAALDGSLDRLITDCRPVEVI